MMFLRGDYVQITMPPTDQREARRFYGTVRGPD